MQGVLRVTGINTCDMDVMFFFLIAFCSFDVLVPNNVQDHYSEIKRNTMSDSLRPKNNDRMSFLGEGSPLPSIWE